MAGELVTPRKRTLESSIYGSVADVLQGLLPTPDLKIDELAADPNSAVSKGRSRAAMFNQGSELTTQQIIEPRSIEDIMLRNFFQNSRVGAVGSGAGNGGNIEYSFDSDGFLANNDATRFVNRG